ncbi:MAG: WG repeat-containing protein [Oscillospiraceae bacterium]|nr:WG repeat-containing protein [Oscillospiraceae bacterium]
MKKENRKKKSNKNEKYGVLVIMIVMIAVGWSGMLGSSDKEDLDYYVSRAEEHEGKGAYITAVECYLKALELTPGNYEYMLKVAENYKNCDDRNGFFDYCDRAIGVDPENNRAYIMKAQYYIEDESYAKAIGVLTNAPVTDEEMKEMLMDASYRYRTYVKSFEDTYGFYGQYAAVMSDEGKWGVIDSEGDMKISAKYDAVGGYNRHDDVVPVCRDGEWYFADINGNKKYVPNNNYTFLGTYRDGYAPVCLDSKYGYIDLMYKEYKMEYDFASSFAYGVAAVCKDGKWALINNSFENITDFEYDSIEVNEYGTCEFGEVITAVKDGQTVYLDLEGNVTEKTDVYFSGVTVTEKDGLFGFATQEKQVIDEIFEEATPFSDYGSAMVKTERGWQVIRFYKYMEY